MEYFTENDCHTICHWKGVADYFDINANGEQSGSAAGVYPSHRTPRTG